ncbi:MAG: hypothetical protein AVDCRST_MAG43-325 [uncultured Thermomicrobiales bacterium]|uniref:Uncharacterized protein n=1 Tax=uncultured Thermomicrobiales bacterium TaxID=1645740 RepID=A0A6J4UAQ5_9BACT|nr:MAG: hypothetical protein AVDCRST_MAG43-325 [uncultured Thermomicrobiales bacterium]
MESGSSSLERGGWTVGGGWPNGINEGLGVGDDEPPLSWT